MKVWTSHGARVQGAQWERGWNRSRGSEHSGRGALEATVASLGSMYQERTLIPLTSPERSLLLRRQSGNGDVPREGFSPLGEPRGCD